MPYDKTIWDETVGVTPARLNNLELQYEKAAADSLPRLGGDIAGNLTIQGQQVVHSGNITIFAPGPANYDDRKQEVTITVGPGKDFTSIQAAIDSLRKINAGPRTISVDGGGPLFNGAVDLSDFHGGRITLRGPSSAARIVQGVGNVQVLGCTAEVFLQYIELTQPGSMFNLQSPNRVSLFECKKAVGNSGSSGVWCAQGHFEIVFCQFNVQLVDAIQAFNGAKVTLQSVTGTGNGNALKCDSAIMWKDSATTITGTVPQSKINGGQIFG